ncbi:DUF58 domain-containing protein [Haloplanus halobius]|uniref:DUF58 domain-containing protein n=1 Tax=Haloplanus halobius TaxID=2934938 RepID=UPI00200CA266|nr:DUF58 domain-containing protein [Haloplanus sp. XH21]
MRGTARYWEGVGIGALVAAGALVFARPLLLVGAVGVWTWLLLHQLRFAHYTALVTDDLTLGQTVSESVITAGDTVTIRLAADCADAAPCPLRLTSLPPLAATAQSPSGRTARLDAGAHHAEAAYDATMDVAGRTAPRGVELRLRDSQGLFVHTWERTDDDCRPTIDVRPYGPRNIHVGSGRESLGRGYGEHETEHSGGGIEPLELREYVPGDSLSRIDWKATARLAEPYIREYEATADRQTLLVVDHRDEMGLGAAGRTMLDHARSVGIAVVATAQQLTDPLGWLAVGDDGLTDFVRPKSTPNQYQRAQRALETLEPTAAEHANATPPDESGSQDTPRRTESDSAVRADGPRAPTTVRERRRVARSLSADDSAFATRLRPFFADTTEYLHRISDDPLFQGVRVGGRRVAGTTWFVIVTSDRRPAELLEAVRTARQGGNHVLVFLTPSVLFDAVDPDDLGAAYERYRSFEQLRQRLDQYQRVTAFEVGPRDRLATVLTGAPASTDQRGSTP